MSDLRRPVYGRPKTTASTSNRCSTRTRPTRSATWPSPHRTPTSCMSGPGSRTTDRVRLSVTAFSRRPTAARRSRTSAFGKRSPLPASSCTRRTRTLSGSRQLATCSARIRSAVSTRPPTEAGRGARCSRSMKTRAPRTSLFTRPIRTSSSPPPTRGVAPCSASPLVARTAASGAARTVAKTGPG